MFKRLALFAVGVALAAPCTADAQSLGERLKRRAEEAAKRAAEQRVADKASEATNAAMDKAENTVKCAASDKKCAEDAKKAGKTVETTTTEAGEVSSAGGASASLSAGGGASSAAKPGEGAWVNYDFVPGNRPVFVDDFSKDNVGDFPRRLELIDGNIEVAELKAGGRLLRVTSWPGRFMIQLPEVLPERFTIEFDATPGYGSNWTTFRFAEKATHDVRFRHFGGKGNGGVFGGNHQASTQTSFKLAEDQLFRGRIMADGKYVKVYMNDARVANIPNADLGRSKTITIEVPGHADHPAFIGNFSIMAGGKKLYDALAESGRVATQGIYFDTGSDRIRPESSPTLKEIAAMLKEHGDLKLAIEGHTDNVGAAPSNLSLSQKRAEAVKATLVSTYGVSGDRLTAKGMGQAKPVGDNGTAEGRQQNRRVELVRM